MNVTNNYYYNNVNVVKYYGNAKYHGVTYVPRHDFLAGHFHGRAAGDPDRMRSVQIVRGRVPLVPTTENLRYTERPTTTNVAVRPALLERTFAGNPVAVQRVPFDQQRVAVARLAHADAEPHRAATSQRTIVAPPAPVLGTPVTATTRVSTTPTVPTNVRSAGDPWARFGTSRGIPETARGATTHVTVIDGTAGTKTTVDTTRAGSTTTGTQPAHETKAWSRFDSSAPRSATQQNVRSTDGSQPARVRMGANETVRSYSAPASATRGNEAPRQQPAQYAAPAARTTTTTSTPHVQQSHSDARSTGGNPHH